ncbi:uncharacterized protein LOC144209938 [Stigmatopora nigra]
MLAVASLLVVLLLQMVVADVCCRWNSSCLFEASFPVGEEVVVLHWRHMSAGQVYVHSFYENAEQLDLQNQRFRGRTSLFKEKLKEGNTSLLLRNVVIDDSGTYQCYVRTDSGTNRSTIQVQVEAPVTAIQIRQVEGNRLLCSSEGIFPRPQIRWFFGPTLVQTPDSNSNVLQQGETKLFSVNSRLRLMGDGEYVCEVSTSNSSRRTTWSKTRDTKVWDIVLGMLGALLSICVVGIIYYIATDRCCRRELKTHEGTTDEEQAEKVPLGKKATSPEVSCPEITEVLEMAVDVDSPTGRYRASNNGQVVTCWKEIQLRYQNLVGKCLPVNHKVGCGKKTIANPAMAISITPTCAKTKWNANRPAGRTVKVIGQHRIMLAVASLLDVLLLQMVVADVWCRWNSSCLFEASFPVGEEVVVLHWRHMSAGQVYVHSFLENADQLDLQNQRVQGRTFLFKEKLKEGKASLLLRNVVIDDSGTYQCYVRTDSRTTLSTIQVHVEAPVTAIQIRQVEGNRLLCSSEGIFPRPQIRWFFGPALVQTPDSNSNVLQQAETKLFSVNSWLPLMGDGEYVCEVSTSKSSRRTTWSKTWDTKVWDIVLGMLGALLSICVVGITYYIAKDWCCRRELKTHEGTTDEEQAEKVPLGKKATSPEVSCPEITEVLEMAVDVDSPTGRYPASNNGQVVTCRKEVQLRYQNLVGKCLPVNHKGPSTCFFSRKL